MVATAPDWDAMVALQELLLPSNGACESYYQQLKAIVRRHCHARFRVPADVRTSEELVLALPRAQRTLQPCLSTCDIVLFGGDLGVAQNHQGAKDAAIAFVAATNKAAVKLLRNTLRCQPGIRNWSRPSSYCAKENWARPSVLSGICLNSIPSMFPVFAFFRILVSNWVN